MLPRVSCQAAANGEQPAGGKFGRREPAARDYQRGVCTQFRGSERGNRSRSALGFLHVRPSPIPRRIDPSVLQHPSVDRRPMGRPIVGRQSVDFRPTVDQQLTKSFAQYFIAIDKNFAEHHIRLRNNDILVEPMCSAISISRYLRSLNLKIVVFHFESKW